MSQTAEALTAQRQSVRSLWQPALGRLWSSLADGAIAPELNLRPGWRIAEAPLADWLLLNRPRDRELGYTTIGPHRADLSLGSPFGVSSEQLSRGQAKLVALALQLAQAEALKDWTGERSLILLDDLQAELDPPRQAAVLAWLRDQGYQALVTGTRVDEALAAQTSTWQRFHVEHGVLGEG
jgi:DNA replication and repair protein RecF